MDYNDIVVEFKRLLGERYPGGYNYIPKLAKILEVHPKTILRKLRGDSQFTITEIVKISRTLNVSMCSLLDCGENTVKHPMEIYLRDFSIPEEYEESLLITQKSFHFAATSNSSRYMVATNIIPDVIYIKYEWFSRFSYLKWLYFNKGIEGIVPLSEIIINPYVKSLQQKYTASINAIKRSVYIFHIDMMKQIADDINFFFQMKYISEEEVMLMIKELHEILNYLEDICIKGFLPLNGKEIDVFYSNVLLPNHITVVDSDNIQFGIVYAYFQNPIITKSFETFKIIKGWFHSLIRSANIISMSGAKYRHVFFTKQREYLDQLEAGLNS